MRFATVLLDGQERAVVADDAGLHPLPGGSTVLDLVRAGLPTALEAGQRALQEPAVPLRAGRLRPPLHPPTIRDFVAFEEHVEGVAASVGGAGVVAEWYEAPTFYFTNPYASRGTWVRAGDVLGSGTCGNGGCLAELWGRRGRLDPPPLRPGDVVEMTVEGIGAIRNTVVPGADLPPVRPARPRPRSRKRTP